MPLRRQVEQLVPTVALANHRAGRRLELETPLAFHRLALRTFEVDRTDRRYGNPGVAALDAEGLAAAVRVVRLLWLWAELDDVAHAAFQLPCGLRDDDCPFAFG